MCVLRGGRHEIVALFPWEMEARVVTVCRILLQNRWRQHHIQKVMGWRSSWEARAPSASREMTTKAMRAFIVAGEPSGDAIGSRLMAALRYLSSAPVEFAGVGGPLMEKEGLQSLFLIDDISVMGLVELIPYSFRLWARLQETVAAALKFEPAVIITVDSKGFSFRVLRGIGDAYMQMGRSRPPTVHYVSPSFWAWKGGEEKLKDLVKIVDHMLCILPFEAAVCQANGLPATFVGHPVLEDAYAVAAKSELHDDNKTRWIKGDGAYFRKEHGIHPEATVLSVLPGSRLQEVHRMLPIFKGALNILKESVPNLTVVIPTVQSQALVQTIEAAIEKWEIPTVLLSGASETEKYNAFDASTAGLCTSGTAVMQLLMSGVPCLVAYRAHPLTEWVIHSRTKLRFISLPNILLDSAVVPEALFSACTPQRLVSHLRLLMEDQELQEKQINSASEVISMLTPPFRDASHADGSRDSIARPSMVAASTVLQVLRNRSGLFL